MENSGLVYGADVTEAQARENKRILQALLDEGKPMPSDTIVMAGTLRAKR